MSALVKKSLTDLTRRKARSAFAILTLAIAVASVGIFALPALADRMMQKEIRSTQLADLVVYTKPLQIDRSQLAALGRPAAERERRRRPLVLLPRAPTSATGASPPLCSACPTSRRSGSTSCTSPPAPRRAPKRP